MDSNLCAAVTYCRTRDVLLRFSSGTCSKYQFGSAARLGWAYVKSELNSDPELNKRRGSVAELKHPADQEVESEAETGD